MKNLLFSLAFLLSTTITFSQQLPLRIVNNSSQTVRMNTIFFYGDGPLLPPECSNCNNYYFSDSFDMISGQSYLIDEYADFNGPPSGLFPATITIHGNSGSSCSSGCTPTQAEGLCGNNLFGGTSLPIWDVMYFSYDPAGIDDDFRLGDPSCGNITNTTYTSTISSFTATRTVLGTEILLVFND